MSKDLMLDVGQADELKKGFRRTRGRDGSRWSNDAIKKLSEGHNLGSVLDVLSGRSRIVPIEQGETEVVVAVPRILKLINPELPLPDPVGDENVFARIERRPLNISQVRGSDVLWRANDKYFDRSDKFTRNKIPFAGGIEREFKYLRSDESLMHIKETQVALFELTKAGEYSPAQLFGTLYHDINSLLLSQGQIAQFVYDHRLWIKGRGYGTYFLFRSGNQLHVAGVFQCPDFKNAKLFGDDPYGDPMFKKYKLIYCSFLHSLPHRDGDQIVVPLHPGLWQSI